MTVVLGGKTVWSGRISAVRQIVEIPLALTPGESRVSVVATEEPADADDTTPGRVTCLVENPRLELRAIAGR